MKFKSFSSAIWFGREKERKILKLCEEHLNKIKEVVVESRDYIYALLEGDEANAKIHAQNIFVKEREGDDIKKKIMAELTKGIFHPINREDIIKLLTTADDAASFAKAAVGRLKYIPNREIDESLKTDLKKQSEMLVEMSNLTLDAFGKLFLDPQETLNIADRVERLEEEIDDLRRESIIPSLMVMLDELDKFKYAFLLKDIIEFLENIADRYEDVIDLIRSMAIGQIK
ncbi:MAG: DUF47 family protein [Nitrososphaerales archaeon]|nr:DUF47 family protein [Nitrososphaerales archaeon]